MSSSSGIFSNDWRITDAQKSLLIDKIPRLSKKEAALLITFMESCLFGRRMKKE